MEHTIPLATWIWLFVPMPVVIILTTISLFRKEG